MSDDTTPTEPPRIAPVDIDRLVEERRSALNRVEVLNGSLTGMAKMNDDLRVEQGRWREQVKVLARDIEDLRQKNAEIRKDAEMAWERVAELERSEAKLLAVMPPSSVPCPTPPPKPYDMDTWEYGYGGKVMRVFTPSELDPVLYGAIQRYVTHVLSPYQRPEVKPRGVGMADPKGTVQP